MTARIVPGRSGPWDTRRVFMIERWTAATNGSGGASTTHQQLPPAETSITRSTTMTEFTPARLAELRAVAEAAFPVEDWAIWEDLTEGGFVHVGNAQGVIPEGEIATPEDAEPNPVAKAYTPELGRHIATFDPPTVLALIAALEAKTAEVDDLAADPGHKAAKYWKWWQREKARSDRAEAAIERVREARSDRAEAAIERVREARAGHPECDKYDDDSPVKCGWMRTVQSIDAALQAIEGAEQ